MFSKSFKFANIVVISQEQECEELQKKIQEVTQATQEMEQKYEKLYDEKIAEGRNRNMSLCKITTGVEVVSDWMDQLVMTVEKRELEMTTPVESIDFEPEIAEITKLIDQLKLPELSGETKNILETEIDDICKELSTVKEKAAEMELEMATHVEEQNKIHATLEQILAERMAEIKSLKK